MNIQIFDNPQFGKIRTLKVNEEPLFLLADLCKVLGLNPSHVRERLDDGVVSTDTIIDRLGREQLANFVNEDGLYDVILDSRKPEARGFRKWVTRDVLPSIRKTGGYVATQEADTPETIMARALVVAKETLKRHEEQLQAERQRRQIIEGQKEILVKENRELAPKAQYTDEVLQSTSTFTTNQIAQGLGLTAIALNRKLHAAGIQFRQSGQWFLTAKYKGKGYATNRVYSYTNTRTGLTETSQTLVWTENGRLFIYSLKNEGKL